MEGSSIVVNPGAQLLVRKDHRKLQRRLRGSTLKRKSIVELGSFLLEVTRAGTSPSDKELSLASTKNEIKTSYQLIIAMSIEQECEIVDIGHLCPGKRRIKKAWGKRSQSQRWEQGRPTSWPK